MITLRLRTGRKLKIDDDIVAEHGRLIDGVFVDGRTKCCHYQLERNKKMEEIKLSEMGEAILRIIETYGTNTEGPAYKQRQQAAAIEKLYEEHRCAQLLLKDMRFVSVKIN